MGPFEMICRRGRRCPEAKDRKSNCERMGFFSAAGVRNARKGPTDQPNNQEINKETNQQTALRARAIFLGADPAPPRSIIDDFTPSRMYIYVYMYTFVYTHINKYTPKYIHDIYIYIDR